ncbi:MAG: 50S ribosomal protein L21e [Nanoarchaeota archaeon]|nr:50S ribosomal protein L21e [Nanoarchaeota archaeon]
MVKRIGGGRRKTRGLFKKRVRKKGKISITRYFQDLKKGDKVQLLAEPAIQDGIYFRRFHGKTGTIKGKKGKCYEVSIKDGSKNKTLIIHPVHLRKV